MPAYWLDYKWDASSARKETRLWAGSEQSVFKADSACGNQMIEAIAATWNRLR
jgi:hypothetical protein